MSSDVVVASPAHVATARAITRVPAREAGVIAATTVTAGALAAAGAWATQPELALAVAIGLGVVGVAPRRAWAAPLTAGATLGGALLAGALDLSPVIGAAAVAGIAVARLVPEPTDALDHVNAALASVAGATFALWGSAQLVPLTGTVWGAVLGAAVVALGVSQAVVPLAIRFDAEKVPSIPTIHRTLEPPYRPPVIQALALWTHARKYTSDAVTRRGLAELVTWVYRLQLTHQTLDQELTAIDVDKVQGRIRAAEDALGDDPITRERRQLTIGHLQRLLAHASTITTERARTVAMVEVAIAYLEEARAGLAISRQLPGEEVPDRLPEVLGRLRAYAAEGDARRRTMHELKPL